MADNNEALARAEAASQFLATEFGAQYIAALKLKYESLHQSAESEFLTNQQKAMRVDKAAGLKIAIDYLENRETLLKDGYYKKK